MTDVIATAGAVKIVITAEGANFTDVTKDVNRQLELLGVKSKAVGGHMVSSVQAASGAIRILEGNVENNVRAVERFLVSSLKLGPILQAAFPVVGLVAFGGVIAKIAKEVHDFVKAAQDAPSAISQAFASSNSAMRLANDQLALANLHLENETAKLEKKPQNHLSEALLESQIQAGKLAESLERVSKAQQEAFKGKEVGFLRELLGNGGTSDVTNNIANFESQIVGRGQDQQIALDNGDKQGAANAKAELDRLQQNYIAYLKGEIAKRSGRSDNLNYADATYAQVHGDQSANLAILGGALTSAQLSVANQRLGEMNAKDSTANDTAKNKAALRQQALEAQRKQIEAMKQDASNQFADMKNDHDVSLAEEIGYWRSVGEAIKGGGDAAVAYRAEINRKIGDLSAQLRRKLEEWQGRRVNLETDDGGLKKVIEQYDRVAAAINKATEARIRNTEQTQIGGAAVLRDSGQITVAGYAQSVAAAHTRAYNSTRDDLQGQIDVLNAFSEEQLELIGKAAQKVELQQKLDELNSNRSVQAAEDYQATHPASAKPMVALGDAFQQLTERSDDLRGAIEGILGQIQSSFNEQIMNALSGKRTDFSNTAAGVFRSVGGKVLDYGEGKLLSGLGLGGSKKPSGTASDPLYIRSADGSGGSSQSGIGGILSKLFGGGSGSSGGSADSGGGGDDGGGAGGFGGIISSLAGAIPFLAEGGPIAGAAIVGERGPELFVPRSSGTIVPSGKFGGDTHHHTWNIDARGSSDPAAVKRMVMQGITQAAPHIIGASVSAMVDRSRRMPSSKR